MWINMYMCMCMDVCIKIFFFQKKHVCKFEFMWICLKTELTRVGWLRDHIQEYKCMYMYTYRQENTCPPIHTHPCTYNYKLLIQSNIIFLFILLSPMSFLILQSFFLNFLYLLYIFYFILWSFILYNLF